VANQQELVDGGMRFFFTGQIFLWLGFLGAALCTVFDLEDPSYPWQTISWPAYLTCIAVGWAGVAILRLGRAMQRKEAAASQVGLEAVVEKLQKCSTHLDSSLARPIEQLTCEQVLDIIDSELVPLMADFAEDRMAIFHRLGTKAYSAIMTEFASGERYLNRAWSAAADGYVDEVSRSVAHSSTFLRAAVHQAHVALAEASSSRAF
jgi:hypothetical protein